MVRRLEDIIEEARPRVDLAIDLASIGTAVAHAAGAMPRRSSRVLSIWEFVRAAGDVILCAVVSKMRCQYRDGGWRPDDESPEVERKAVSNEVILQLQEDYRLEINYTSHGELDKAIAACFHPRSIQALIREKAAHTP